MCQPEGLRNDGIDFFFCKLTVTSAMRTSEQPSSSPRAACEGEEGGAEASLRVALHFAGARGVSAAHDSPIGKCVVAPMVARAARGATGGGARAFEVGMAVKVPMPSTCAAAATRAPDFVPLRGAPFADKSCGPPAGRAKKSRVARRARAQEVPLDVVR